MHEKVRMVIVEFSGGYLVHFLGSYYRYLELRDGLHGYFLIKSNI